MKIIDEKYFTNPEQYIPEGIYCGKCPFLDYNETLPVQENGYCHYLKQSDYDINNSEEGTLWDVKTGEKITIIGFPVSLLWDSCKECNIKMNCEVDNE